MWCLQKIMHRPIIAILLCFLSFITTKAQVNKALPDQQKIEELTNRLINSDDDQTKSSLNKQLKETLILELNKESAFQFSFSSVKSMSIFAPPDSSFRLFNWSIPWNDGTYNYECGILKRNENGQTDFYFLKELEDIFKDDVNWENTVLRDSIWPGGLYYQLIAKSDQLPTYYILLNWDGNNRLTNKKSIDVLWLGSNGATHFGAPIFVQENKKKNRILFEYAGEQAMNLRYNKKLDRIEFDQLYPIRSDLEGIYEYYYPEVVKDAFKWEDEKWIFMKDINFDEEKYYKARKQIEKRKEEVLLENGPIFDMEKAPIYKLDETPKNDQD